MILIGRDCDFTGVPACGGLMEGFCMNFMLNIAAEIPHSGILSAYHAEYAA